MTPLLLTDDYCGRPPTVNAQHQHKFVSVLLMTLSLLIASGCCTKEKLIQDPTVVKTTVTKFVAVPSALLVQHAPVTIPEGEVTFSETNDILALDRATIKTLNGQLKEIGSLTVPEDMIVVE